MVNINVIDMNLDSNNGEVWVGVTKTKILEN